MNEEEKKAIEDLRGYLKWVNDRRTEGDKSIEIVLNLISKLQKENDTLITTINKQSKDISEQLKELDKKDKIINYIFEYLTDTEWDNCCFECEQLHSCPQDYDALLECIKKYFYKKVEEENE